MPCEKFDSAVNPNAAMPLAQFADPWQKVQIKPDSEVTTHLIILNLNKNNNRIKKYKHLVLNTILKENYYMKN